MSTNKVVNNGVEDLMSLDVDKEQTYTAQISHRLLCMLTTVYVIT